MRFVQRGSDWLLIDENAPVDACVIAVLRSKVEVVALNEFCKLTLTNPEHIPEHYPIRFEGADYTVTPLGAPGEKLTLVISGNGRSSAVVTEFAMPDKLSE